MNTCKATAKDGAPCTAPAQTGKDYCFIHDPEQEHARAEARAKGGQTRAEQLTGAIVLSLTTAEAVRDYLSRVARDTEAQLIPPKTATAIAALARVQLEAIERADKEASDRAWGLRFPV